MPKLCEKLLENSEKHKTEIRGQVLILMGLFLPLTVVSVHAGHGIQDKN